jgi:alpha-galactosidase
MNGQFGISSRIFEWSPELKQRASQNVALYKRLRTVIATGDCYHLTPPPPHENPTGWMALQYVSPDRARSVALIYRLVKSEAQRTFKLRGLDPQRKYRLQREGRASGEFTGGQLAGEGVAVSLPAEWQSCVLELSTE